MYRKSIVTAALLFVALCVPLFSQSQDFQMDGTVLVRYRGNAAQVTIPAGVTAIGDFAFFMCNNLTSVTIPSSVTSIGDKAFSECLNLAAISIPASVTSIGDGAFAGCGSLKTVMVSGKTKTGKDAFPVGAAISYSDSPGISQNATNRHNDLGVEYYNNGKYDEAISEFTEAIKENPNNADFFFNRGYTYLQKGNKDYENNYSNDNWMDYIPTWNWEQIISDFTEAIRLDETYAAAYFWRGYAYQDEFNYSHNWDQSILDFTKSIEFQFNLANSYNNRGYGYAYEYYDKHDYAKALADYNEALKLEPENVTFIANRAYLFFNTQEYQRAAEEYTRAIAMNPSSGFYYCMRGLSYSYLEDQSYTFKGVATARELERWNRIIDDLEKSFELGYDDMGTRGMDYFLENFTWKKRISEVTLRINNDKNNPALYELLGDIYVNGYQTNEDNYENAGYFRATERFRAKERNKYLKPGEVFDVIGAGGGGGSGHDWANAWENYNKALALTNAPTAWLNTKMGVVVLKNYKYNPDESRQERDANSNNRREAALPYFVRASGLNANNKLVFHWLGNLYYEKADYQSAIQAYSDVLRIDPKDTLALHNRGVLFQDLKDYDRAIADYTAALNSNADSWDTKRYLDVAIRSRSEN